VADGKLAELWRCRAPRGARLLGDEYGRRVVAAWPDERVLKFAELGRAQPTPPESGAELPGYGLRFNGTFIATTAQLREQSAHALHPIVSGSTPTMSAIDKLVDSAIALDHIDPLYARMVYCGLRRWQRTIDVDAPLTRLRAALPDNQGLAMERALHAASAGRWSDVRALLTEPLAGLDSEEAAQATSLLCIACLHCGDAPAARAALNAGVQHFNEEQGHLLSYLDACQNDTSPSVEPEWSHLWPALACDIGQARRELDAGRPAEALQTLDRIDFIGVGELQSRAIRAEARLALPTSDDADRLAEAELLADFLASHADHQGGESLITNLPVPGVSLGADELSALAGRAESRLEAIAGGG